MFGLASSSILTMSKFFVVLMCVLIFSYDFTFQSSVASEVTFDQRFMFPMNALNAARGECDDCVCAKGAQCATERTRAYITVGSLCVRSSTELPCRLGM